MYRLLLLVICISLVSACDRSEPKAPFVPGACERPRIEDEQGFIPPPADLERVGAPIGESAEAGTAATPELASSRVGQGLLAIDPQQRPYVPRVPALCMPRGTSYKLVLRICVSETGSVSSVKLVRPSFPLLDQRVGQAVWRWKYRPYIVDGRAKPFCYPLVYNAQ